MDDPRDKPVQLKVVVPESLRDELRAEAQNSGMTINALVIARLRPTAADRQRALEQAFGGWRLLHLAAGLIRDMREGARRVAPQAPIDGFLDDPAAYAEAEKEAIALLRSLRPRNDGTRRARFLIDPPERFDEILLSAARARDEP